MVAFTEEVEAKIKDGIAGAWYVVAKSVQVPAGATLPVKALGRRLVLWRGEDGVVRCADESCPHRGAPLSRGRVVGNDLSCGYHGLTIDGEGVIVRVPALPNCSLVGQKPRSSYTVRELADGIFVYFPSAEFPEPRPFSPPSELTDPDYAVFLCAATWTGNWRYAAENLVDPMHASYLHAESFTLAYGSRQDKMRIAKLSDGFRIEREGQRGVNFDWCESHMNNAVPNCRLEIPYPKAAGPGGVLDVLAMITPVDAESMRIFFWRMRRVSGIAREAWRFLFRARLEPRHWEVLEQDHKMISAMPTDARDQELLYQHDLGVTRLRQWMIGRARSELAAERSATNQLLGSEDRAMLR